MRVRRHHDVAGGHVGHAQHALEHGARLGLDQLAVLGVGQRPDQLGLAVGAGQTNSTRRSNKDRLSALAGVGGARVPG